MTLDRLALSRSTVDRSAERRADPKLLAELFADPQTAVLLLDGDQAPVIDVRGLPRLALLAPLDAAGFLAQPFGPATLGCYLGTDAAGRSYLAIAFETTVTSDDGSGRLAAQVDRPAPQGARWAGLREVAALLDDTDAGLLTTAVAVTHWHRLHPHCARCGQLTDVVQAGWARGCPVCGAEHYPRTDPAVIMTVLDDDNRLLLGRQARWPEKRFSTLAGFVEPGESLEAAVRREVAEESGVVVAEVDYLGSQPWPFPASLMLGFTARATHTDIQVDGVELSQARWWTREELSLDLATGELLLPPRVSIARRLIEHWYGSPLDTGADAWR